MNPTERPETTPAPPYYAVLFTSELNPDVQGYAEVAARMVELASMQPGYLGIHSARDAQLGITLSYWESEAAITGWKANLEHLAAQAAGRGKWYRSYTVQVARVERAYTFGDDSAPTVTE